MPSGVGRTDPYFSGLMYLYGEARRRYPESGWQGWPRSLDESLERARNREDVLKKRGDLIFSLIN
jgi:hypothetical protein